MDIKLVIDDEHLEETTSISLLAGKAGLHVERVIPEFGTIFGSGDSELLDKLRRIDGVARAVPEGGVQLPPLNEKIPQ